jgi:hypothetical protein
LIDANFSFMVGLPSPPLPHDFWFLTHQIRSTSVINLEWS